MSYIKQNFIKGQELEADHLNYMENGISAASAAVEYLFPRETKEGNTVSCEALEGYSMDVVCDLSILQSGTGDPSPGNVRDIIPHSHVAIYAGGKNLLFGVKWQRGYIYYQEGANQGKANSDANSNFECTQSYIYVGHLRGKTIIINKSLGGSSPGTAFYSRLPSNETEAIASYCYGVKSLRTVVPMDALYMRFSIASPKDQPADKDDIQMELGDTTTTYERPRGRLSTVNFGAGDACYGGKFDLRTGLLTKTHDSVKFSDLSWEYNDEMGYYKAELPNLSFTEFSSGHEAACSILKFAPSEYNAICEGANHGELQFAIRGSSLVIPETIDPEDYADAMIVYPLVTPTYVTIEYTDSDHLVAGQSESVDIYSSGLGNVRVTYLKPGLTLTQRIEELEDKVDTLYQILSSKSIIN